MPSNDADSTSTSFLARLRNSHGEAWNRFSDLYGPLVYHWCRRSGLRAEDAADTLQEVFRSVAGNIGHFEKGSQRGTFRAWLWTITRNKIRDYFRAQGGQAVAVGGTDAQLRLANIPDDSSDSSTDHDRGELSGLFQRALVIVQAEFEDRTWNAFWRIAVEGRDTANTAAEFGMSVNAARQAKSRVLRRLRVELGDLFE